ncbi:MAG: RNA polymerase sigma factor [Saprospiraceae bacterium]|nr:RNA polymerase sigma factor [Saprospiraceae bacterium]
MLIYPSETELIELLRQGDENAFQYVCTTYQNRIYNAALCIVQSVEDAEDIVQETFVEAFLNVERFNQKSKLSTWLYRIAVNKSLNHRRMFKAQKRLGTVLSIFNLSPHDDKPDFVHPAALLEQQEHSTLILKAVDKLPEKQRMAFVLRQQEELSYLEIAEVMQTSIPSVESLLFRAKQNLQQALKEKL